MMATDVAEAVAWMEVRWGRQEAWRSWEQLWLDFAPYTAGALKETLTLWYRSGAKFAPKPAELLKAIAEVQHRRVDAGEDEFESKCSTHVWADPLPYDEDRHRTCVRCGAVGGAARCEHVFNGRKRCVYCLEGT